jgi:tRNA 2-thiocytidine biosynthesis protein TtcA
MGVTVNKQQPARALRLPGPLNRKIGRAMHDWRMLDHGDRVLVAVSGGVDSLVTAWVLHQWRAKAPIDYEVEAVHIVNDPVGTTPAGDRSAESIGRQVRSWGLAYSTLAGRPVPPGEDRTCFVCARNRRSQLFDLARQRGCRKVALGHHKDDLIETFFINSLYSGNLSTMLPRQDLFGGRLSLIRILSYLEKRDVLELAELAGIEPVADRCPLAGDTRRDTVRELLAGLYAVVPGAKESVFAALGNVRYDYLLSRLPAADHSRQTGGMDDYGASLSARPTDQEQL